MPLRVGASIPLLTVNLMGNDGAERLPSTLYFLYFRYAGSYSISMVLHDGREVAWIDDIADLPPAVRTLLQDELDGRKLMPEIVHIASVSSFATPCTWCVKTDRGDTEFVLKDEGDIRRTGDASLLVADNHGIHFLVRNMFTIDKHSRKILDRFL